MQVEHAQVPQALQKAVLSVHAARAAQATDRVSTLTRVAKLVRNHYSQQLDSLLGEAKAILKIGAAPSLRELCGLTELEVPLNRTLGWLLTPTGSHGADHQVLLTMARAFDCVALAEDIIDRPGDAEVYCETTPDDFTTGCVPDFLVRTPRAALMIENKVNAGESGDQFEPYLRAFESWADAREQTSVLLAPTLRATPDGWTASRTHVEVAQALRPLTRRSHLPTWTRVMLSLVVRDLESRESRSTVLELSQLHRQARERQLSQDEIVRLERLCRSAATNTPWIDALPEEIA